MARPEGGKVEKWYSSTMGIDGGSESDQRKGGPPGHRRMADMWGMDHGIGLAANNASTS